MAFNGTFLPSTVGMAVADGDMKEGFKRVFMEKLRAIIGENRLKFMAVGAKVAAKVMKRGGHGGLRISTPIVFGREDTTSTDRRWFLF